MDLSMGVSFETGLRNHKTRSPPRDGARAKTDLFTSARHLSNTSMFIVEFHNILLTWWPCLQPRLAGRSFSFPFFFPKSYPDVSRFKDIRLLCFLDSLFTNQAGERRGARGLVAPVSSLCLHSSLSPCRISDNQGLHPVSQAPLDVTRLGGYPESPDTTLHSIIPRR